MNILGYITLNLSTIIYLIWFVPQIILNFKRKNTEGLSMLMYGILCVGYFSDLMYGFGLDMQWQYRLVTIVGLSSLAIQNIQFGRYGLREISEKYFYILLNALYFLGLAYAIYIITSNTQHRNFYDSLGMLANVCWFSYMVPQIIKNHQNKSTVGLSVYFVFLAIFLNLCDSVSAWALEWDYPSKVGPCIALVGNSILLWQIYRYEYRT